MTVAAAALIVDHNWLVDQRDTIKNASDAAAVAATIEMTRPGVQGQSDSELKAHLEGVAKTYAELNLLHLSGERLQKARNSLEVKVEPNRASNTVEVRVSADLGGTLFSRHLWGMGKSTGPEKTSTVAKVAGTSNPVEVVLAIDTSGSMGRTLDGGQASVDRSNSRMGIVKRAATSLVEILGPNAENRVAVGLVPWHAQVRLDSTTRSNWSSKDKGWAKYPAKRLYDEPYFCSPIGRCSIQEADIQEAKKTQRLPNELEVEDWLGCLDEHRVDDVEQLADLPAKTDLLKHPGDSAFAQGFYVSWYGHAHDCLQSPFPDNLLFQFCYDVGSGDSRISGGQAAQYYCPVETPTILPLTSGAKVAKDAIVALKPVAAPTYSALGVLWAARLLDSGWKNVWGDSVHPVDPASEDGAGARKAIVLLTDGEDNVCGDYDPLCTTNNVGIARKTACDIAKKAGFEIFVVAAMDPEQVSGTLGESLKTCSSQADNPDGNYVFLNNTDEEALERAFADIANQLKVYRRVY